MQDHFRYFLRVRYNECDAQRVVFNARYGDYVDLASTYFFKQVLGQLGLTMLDFDFQTVKQTTQWTAPARFDDVLAIAVHITHVGTTSFTFVTDMTLAETNTPVATSETIAVAVDAKTLQKKPLTEEIKAALVAGAPGVVVDHAGFGV
ncbi:MAG TPA: thioesterase family protein [Alcanivoracaceae bacterium]|nr:thioesterase family protein [Alcanivoracaceae bacterium]